MGHLPSVDSGGANSRARLRNLRLFHYSTVYSSSEHRNTIYSYTTILDSEQRSRYKADFNADYNEYRDLHAAVENVSRHFAELEERLRQEEVNSPGWRSIKQQIMREYQENKRDQQHQEAKRRFQYLHEKLSHIKRLVQEYDSELAGQQY